MKAIVIKSFIDGNNKRLHRRNRTVNLTQEKFDKLSELGYVKEAPEDSEVAPAEVKNKKNIKLKNLKK